MTHYIELCEFGGVHAQCRCPARDKPVTKVKCDMPEKHSRPGETSETLGFDRPQSVDNPGHYRTGLSGVECIEVVRALSFDMGNCIKYLWRLGNKDEDKAELKKAVWYLVDDRLNVGLNGWRQPRNLSLWSSRFEEHIVTLPNGNVRLALEALRQSFLRHGSKPHLDIAERLLRKEAELRGIPSYELRAA